LPSLGKQCVVVARQLLQINRRLDPHRKKLTTKAQRHQEEWMTLQNMPEYTILLSAVDS